MTNGAGAKVYWNGNLESQDTTVTSRSKAPPPGNVVIGRFDVDVDGRYTSVEIDEFAIWDQVLTDAQIKALSDYYLPPS